MTASAPAPEGDAPPRLGGRRLAIQLVGFAVGIALLVWCVREAAAEGGWEKLRAAPPMLLVAMLLCSLGSAVVNGTTFWITVRPIKPLRWGELQLVNLAANMLNFAPVRLGAIGRVWWHYRIDGLSILQIGGWFAFIGYVLVLGLASCFVATAAHPVIDLWWILLVVGQMVVGGLCVRFLAGTPLLARHGRGLERMVASPAALWGAAGLRLVDLAMYATRMAIAAKILGIDLPLAHLAILGFVALAASLSPVGRLGIREACVALAARWLEMQATDVASSMQSLALVDSAAEAAVMVGGGAIAALLLRPRARAARARAAAELSTI